MAAFVLPLGNNFKYFILLLSDIPDSSTVARNCPDHSGHSNGSPILSDTILGIFINTDAAGANACVEVKEKAEEGTGVGTSGFTGAA